jgi:hypothetical protein
LTYIVYALTEGMIVVIAGRSAFGLTGRLAVFFDTGVALRVFRVAPSRPHKRRGCE